MISKGFYENHEFILKFHSSSHAYQITFKMYYIMTIILLKAEIFSSAQGTSQREPSSIINYGGLQDAKGHFLHCEEKLR